MDTWVCTPQPATPEQLPQAPFAGSTLRQTVRASVGGQRIRLRLSNAFGTAPLSISAVAVGLPAAGAAGVSAVAPGSSRPVSFAGRRAVSVPAGEELLSDPVDLPVGAGANLTVTMSLPAGEALAGVTSHPGSRTTSYLAPGSRATDPDLPGSETVDHWYFLSGLQVPAAAGFATAVAVGDSLTDGRGSTTNGNDRWPDQLADRLRTRPETRGIAVLNHGVGGSRLLDDGRGPGAVSRLVRAALARPGLQWLVLFKGINDIGVAAATVPAQRQVTDELLAAYDQLVAGLREHRVRVYGATLPPFGGNAAYDDPAGLREQARQRVNGWIRGNGRFDAVVDFDVAVRDPGDPRRIAPGCDEGDHLHLSPAGYAALAAAVPDHLFSRGPDHPVPC